ncbi:hypothetical protein [Sinorhizobium sp. RAC02]|uniref:hypothetical protein n=1 Tax=Sinorhizobium sp. RAC02 TaxID=1842534 RepID=UPI001237216E|nr:hypothetical protein [Sinorhizobium sp. RAC02]
MKEKDNSMGPLRNRILDSIRPQAQEFFRMHADVRPMNTGDVIFEDGAPVTHVVFPHEGVVSIIADNAIGTRH